MSQFIDKKFLSGFLIAFLMQNLISFNLIISFILFLLLIFVILYEKKEEINFDVTNFDVIYPNTNTSINFPDTMELGIKSL